MAGLLRAPAARTLVTALRENFDLPVHLHTHDTAGGQIGTLLAAIDAGVDAVDAATRHDVRDDEPAEPVGPRRRHRRHRAARPASTSTPSSPSSPTGRPCATSTGRSSPGLASPTGRVYFHEIPGGQLSNLRQQAIALGLGDRFEDVENMYAAANRILGNIVKVTPSSKVVGDLALALVGAGADPDDFEENPTATTSPTRSSASSAASSATRPAAGPSRSGPRPSQGRTPKPRVTELTDEQERGAGHRHPAHPQPAALPGPDDRVRGHPRPLRRPLGARHHRVPPRARAGRRVRGRDRGRQAAAARHQLGRRRRPPGHARPSCAPSTASSAPSRCVTAPSRPRPRPPRRPTRATPGHVAAPFAGVVTPAVAEGDTVEPGAVVATIEAMKMEANITSRHRRHGRAARHRRSPAGRGR